MTFVKARIFYADEWVYDERNDRYINTITGEEMAAEEFETKLIIG